ncbi:hypothetical protein [Candidatus Uabimicrobium amorphum]|uniref:FrpA/C n=1 Tax=Uabimicrobium amorphum TaxID=2596890 RepID=A0A5S9ILF3_UABAM|nr:hypothetical protein [Candidatus Uabimicrobium amorphum]BBM84049.1 FrpA/C [Candidatus Uabimicrobium amorphum]
MKYFIIFLLIPTLALSSLWADDGDSVVQDRPENFMDSPVKSSELPPVFGIEFHDDLMRMFRTSEEWWVNNNYLENSHDELGIGHVLEYLADLDEHQHHGNGTAIRGSGFRDFGIVEGDAAAFTNAISNFISQFNSSSEVFNSVIMQGESTFFNALGQETTNTDPGAVYDDYEGENTDTIAVFAGRNTAAAQGYSTNEELLMTITTPEGVFEVNAFGVSTPIVLDMDGDKRLQASAGQWLPHKSIEKDTRRAFDINGDGFPEVIEWVGPNDGLLVQYDGGEINGNHLFGDAGGFKHGFEKLSLLDKNNDGVLTGAELETLSVWQDKNSNAKVDSGEVQTLEELNITSIGVKHRMFTASFTQNGESKMLWDWHPATHTVKKIK